MRKDNATFLFERPFKQARSERYWSALLATFLVHLGGREAPTPIPTWHLDYDPPHWAYREHRRFDTSGITWDGLFVEPAPRGLLKHVGGGRLRPMDEQILARHLGEPRGDGPDLVIFRPEGSLQIALVAVKTAGTRLAADAIKRYRDAERMLHDQLGLSTSFLLVCAVGDARASGIDEREISGSRIELLLWDRLLEMMAQDKEFKRLLPKDVLAYTNAPIECACPRTNTPGESRGSGRVRIVS